MNLIRDIPERSEKIFNRFPSLFPPYEVRRDASKSCLAWGIECGDGWLPIITDCLQAIVDTNIPVQISQIKEKFGTLRIYYSIDSLEINDHNTIQQIVAKAEERAAKTCEVSGEEGSLRRINGWLVTLSDAEYSKRIEDENQSN